MKRQIFVLLSLATLVVFLMAWAADSRKEWVGIQERFNARAAKPEPIGIRQIMVAPLNRIDRCTTCHLAIDRPKAAQAEQPFTAHPGDYLKSHPVEKFACTVCHAGQGLATTVQAGHGEVRHWEQPLLRGALVQSSCAKCHGDLETIKAYAPMLVRGRQLFKEEGCIGCHALHGFGQTVSVDLSEAGSKNLHQLDMTFVKGPHTLSQWLYEHFKDPQRITPGFTRQELPQGEMEIAPTAMPNYRLTDEEAQALTIYMMSLTDEQVPGKYVKSLAAPEPPITTENAVAYGRAVFDKYGCVGCHGQNGQGGRNNWNAVDGQQVPALTYVKAGYTKEALKAFIARGSQPLAKLDPHGPSPSLYMPRWQEKISDEELNALVEYLYRLAPDETASAAPTP
ncbi:MAG: c-type cytochrome [Candidatus Omnitrophica bacterium]|nr:c-type cytochrome [Candidatus Omnitrophota bacterium]